MAKKQNKNSDNAELQKLISRLEVFLKRHRSKAFTAGQIYRKLDIKGNSLKQALNTAINQLVDDGKATRVGNGRIKSSEKAKAFVGRVDYVNPRFGFVISEDPADTEDVYVREDDMLQALDDDLVEVEITGSNRQGKLEGRVTRIIERKRVEFVGRMIRTKTTAFVRPDFKKMHHDIYVSSKNINNAEDNDKVVVEITQWPEWEKNPEGKVTNVLGKAGEHEAEIHSIMAEFALPFAFPDVVEREAEKISEEIHPKEIAKRWDFRGITTFTIDPEDAKDFDDALSIEKLDGGLWRIGVHIADVTHYVLPGTILDKEAFRRATSVYLVDRTIPMLPEKLSNGLCSLRPNEDKLTFSAVFDLDENGKVHKEWFGRTVIHSDMRFAYEDAQERIETGKGEFAAEIILMNNIAKKMKAERFKRGAIAFETVEVKFKLDEKGKPLGMFPKVRKDAHKMIEEFMLLANKKVAEYVYFLKNGKEKNTFVYRTHDNPDPERLDSFSIFAKRFGHQLDLEEGGVSSSINKLMAEIEGKPEQNVLEQLAIRSMAKAKYTTDPKGHFGLAFRHYTHFTSPIRRYPDVMVHRLLQEYLDGKFKAEKDEYEVKCQHSSEREKNAADAERASIKYKQVEFMSMAEDKDYDGVVTGVTEWGVFVEMIETKCEGMVRVSEMKDDFYEFDEKNYRLVGRKGKKIITLGDQVMVRVINTDIDRRTIDLEFVRK
ncbi:ribonuclease R [Fulvivirgaceae bacterium LMO-SS25]